MTDSNNAENAEIKTAESDGSCVLIISRGQWGRGETIHEAASNHPRDLTKVTNAEQTDVIVNVFTWKKGDKIPEGCDTMRESVYLDGMGSTHYAADMGFCELNQNPVPLHRLFSENTVEQ